MNNNNCILIEFSNEKNKIQTGFSDWLENKEDVKNLSAIIVEEKVTIINWSNIDPAPASKLKLKGAQWTREPIKILGHGTWKEMRKMQSNLEKYGYSETSKEDRKLLKRKICDDNNTPPKVSKTVSTAASTSTSGKGTTSTTSENKELLESITNSKTNLIEISYSDQNISSDEDDDSEVDDDILTTKSYFWVAESWKYC